MSLGSPQEHKRKLSYEEVEDIVGGYYRTLTHSNLGSDFQFPEEGKLALKNQAIARVTKLILDPEFQQMIKEESLSKKTDTKRDAVQIAIDAGCSSWDYAIAVKLVKELVLK